MTRLRHKPTEVDAVLWDDSYEARKELSDLGYRGDCGEFNYVYRAKGAPRALRIPTDDRVQHVIARPGESWVIRGTQGEWYCIPNDVKAACYEQVSS